MSRADKAKQYFLDGYNCAQAVVMAFADDIGLDLTTAQRISAPFGGGIGRMREVCGAVSGMAMVEGMMRDAYEPKNTTEKAAQYKLVQELANEYKAENGSIVCRELLGLDRDGNKTEPTPSERTEQYYHKRPCAELVYQAAEILERKFF